MVPPDVSPVPSDARRQFLQTHPERGTLRIQVATARGAFPVTQAAVAVRREFDEAPQTLYQGTTDISGIVQGISLPALPVSYSQNPATAENSGTVYQVSVYHPSYLPVESRTVTIFSNIETILPVVLEPSDRT